MGQRQLEKLGRQQSTTVYDGRSMMMTMLSENDLESRRQENPTGSYSGNVPCKHLNVRTASFYWICSRVCNVKSESDPGVIQRAGGTSCYPSVKQTKVPRYKLSSVHGPARFQCCSPVSRELFGRISLQSSSWTSQF